ncbi:Strongly-conserved Zn-finger binding protein (TFIIIA) [Pestalotiopsis sp. 9143b]|nr:Strongly-conserved Zn-finger binding protein (TFIIIA) [Pestalotiopsis sp. 9143b]
MAADRPVLSVDTMKRKNQEDGEVAEASKRSRRLFGTEVEDSYPVVDNNDDAKDSDYSDQDGSVNGSVNESVENASSPDTVATTVTVTSSSPRKKFPSDLKTIKCTWPGCDKAFNRPARLTAHLRSHKNERPFKCPHAGCDKSYLEEKHLKQHLGGSHSTERKHICEEPGCGKSFLTSTRLRRHQLVHEGQERFRCREYPPCNQSFRKHQTLQRHIRAEHLKMPGFVCKNAGCGAGFDTASSLRRHVEKEHADLKYWCDECNNGLTDDAEDRVGFSSAEQLLYHMKKAHISCTFCDKIFPTRDAMEAHTEMEHASNVQDNTRKSVVCTRDGCGKVFSKQSNLQAHVRSFHEGVRYICGEHDVSTTKDLHDWPKTDGCGGSFATKASLEKHIRHVHMDIPRPLPPRSEVQQQAPRGDMLGQLTGTSNSARRTIACPWFPCDLKFAHQPEMQAHLSTHFDMNLGETLAQDFSMSNLPDPSLMNFEIPSPFTSHPVTPGLGEEWGYSAPATPHGQNYFPEAQEWQQDEAEMRQLIGPNDLGGLLDPALRQP